MKVLDMKGKNTDVAAASKYDLFHRSVQVLNLKEKTDERSDPTIISPTPESTHNGGQSSRDDGLKPHLSHTIERYK